MGGAWLEQPPKSLVSKMAVPPPGGSGTTARAKLVSDKTQRYKTVSRKEGKRQGKLSLSHTPEEGKERVRKVYVN